MIYKTNIKTLRLVKPLINTWNGLQDAADWIIEFSQDFASLSTSEVNKWYVDSLLKTIDAFSSLIVIWQIYIVPNDLETEGKVIKWEEKDNSYQDYINFVINEIKNCNFLIESLEIKIDLQVYVNTAESTTEPTLSRIRLQDEFLIYSGLDDNMPYLYLSIDHTLFCQSSYPDDEDNSKLYFLNQPLLEQALKNWEEKFDAKIESEGLPGIYQYGFKPEDQWQ